MFDLCSCVGCSNVLIARRIVHVVREKLLFMCRHMPTKSSMYPSTQPKRGRLIDTSMGSVGANGVVGGCSIGGDIDSGFGCVACVFVGS